MTSPAIPPLSSGQLEQLAKELAETTTGSELNEILSETRLEVSDQSTKWRRLRESFVKTQARDGSANAVARFATVALDPARFVHDNEVYEAHRNQVNNILSFSGLSVTQSGQLKSVKVATTITEAKVRTDSLRASLKNRDVHSDVLKFCQVELLADNYFHAVLEAAKSLADKIRSKTGLSEDGSELAQAAFTTKRHMPPLAFNSLSSPSEISEHRGLALMVQGLFMTFRNPTAHEPKVRWAIDEGAALDMLAMTSMLHRRLDSAAITPSAPAYRS